MRATKFFRLHLVSFFVKIRMLVNRAVNKKLLLPKEMQTWRNNMVKLDFTQVSSTDTEIAWGSGSVWTWDQPFKRKGSSYQTTKWSSCQVFESLTHDLGIIKEGFATFKGDISLVTAWDHRLIMIMALEERDYGRWVSKHHETAKCPLW